ncbi:MAG: 4Fe-4S dicluster domain-containing protein [Nitrospiraceae bacterium]|nr:4Fe-4S dicluster domain-containing protein [Nitrospiraceae bacterium]
MMPNGIDLDGLKKGGASPSGVERREFLKIGLAITGVFAGGTVFSLASNVGRALASPDEVYKKYPYKPHYSMVIRQNRCIDCERCKQACKATNHVPDYGYRTTILEKDVPGAIGQKREFIPVLCNQCNNPPCVRACPTGASYKDKTTGIVLIEDKKCIGCKTCMLACPYNARYFDDEKRSVDKCNFCFDTRLSKGEKLTACAAICPAHARVFGDLSERGGEVYQLVHQIVTPVWVLRPSVGTKPNVFYTKG